MVAAKNFNNGAHRVSWSKVRAMKSDLVQRKRPITRDEVSVRKSPAQR